MATLSSPAFVSVRLPEHYPARFRDELRKQFPQVKVRVGGVDRIIEAADNVCSLATEAYEWTVSIFRLGESMQLAVKSSRGHRARRP